MKASIAAAVVCAAALLMSANANAQSPAPPANLIAKDHSWDNGTRIDLDWSLSSDDAQLAGYLIRKKAAGETEFSRVDLAPAGMSQFTVADLDPKRSYFFEVAAVGKDNAES